MKTTGSAGELFPASSGSTGRAGGFDVERSRYLFSIGFRSVACLEDKPKEWDVPGKYGCKNCRATCDKKKKLCKPVKLDKKK
jgi:hypothetical protein